MTGGGKVRGVRREIQRPGERGWHGEKSYGLGRECAREESAVERCESGSSGRAI